MFKIIIYFFQSIFIYFCFLITFILRKKISRKIFSSLFVLIGPIFKSKKIIKYNLNIFSSYNEDFNEKKIINKMWSNYGLTFVEYIFLNEFRKNNFHISIKGKEILSSIKSKNKPVIFVSGHFANFELMSMEITKSDIKLATIYRPLNNIFLNPLMELLRKKYVCANQIKKGINGVREAIEYLKRNYSIALMIDQRVSEGALLNLFGKPALTTTLPAQLALKFDLDIVPVYIERNDNNNFFIEFKEPINNRIFENKIKLTQELNKVLEEMIIRNPNQWIWTHNRWK